jgi:hypothetical protein
MNPRAPVLLPAFLWPMVLALLLAACASSQINAQWSDPQFAGQPARGAKVLVACQASDPTLRRICADRSAAKLAALGAVPVLAPDSSDPAQAAAADEQALLQAARRAGAVALWRTQLSPEVVAVAPGPSIGIGIGGFGGGYRSGGGVGFGVSAPLAAGPAETGYAASASLTDVASGKLMWSARASAPPSSDLAQQLSTLTGLLLDAARQAGMFAA